MSASNGSNQVLFRAHVVPQHAVAEAEVGRRAVRHVRHDQPVCECWTDEQKGQ